MYMQTEVVRERLLTKAKTLKVLPSLHDIIDKVFSVLNDRNSSFEQLENVVQYDQAICSKIMSIANSAYFCRGLKILNLHRAMVVIGFEEIKNIITCLVFLDEILKKMKLRQDHFRSLWHHSLYVAYSAKVLSAKTFVEDPEKTFTTALLHDVGKIILYMSYEGYGDMLEESQQSGKDLCHEEKELFGTDHQEIGYYMAVKWRFPDEFSRVIRNHHDGRSGGQCEMLLRLVRIADRFATFPDENLGMEGLILVREKERIESEIARIMELLGLTDEKN
jgi:putative nucleotidyltransferase with HDIG domain